MPRPDEILRGLGAIANGWWALAVLWHVYFLALAGALSLGAPLVKRTTGLLLGLPFFCVSALAWSEGNPFNGAVFAALALAAIGVAARLTTDRVELARPWLAVPGALLFVFGWIYPHFLEASSRLAYLVAAPTGLLPCPTLSIVIGLSLTLAGLGSSLWLLLLGVAGALYGVVGALYLGVTIDAALLIGAVLCLIAGLRGR
jgi:hypothetical protein